MIIKHLQKDITANQKRWWWPEATIRLRLEPGGSDNWSVKGRRRAGRPTDKDITAQKEGYAILASAAPAQ